MDANHIAVVYKWTAHEGKLDELARIYRDVTQAMHDDEPGAKAVHCYVSRQENALYVRDEFQDAAAMGFHLGTTAARHVPQLLQVADPGTFLFFGEVPAEMQQAALQMGLPAEYASHDNGFDRA